MAASPSLEVWTKSLSYCTIIWFIFVLIKISSCWIFSDDPLTFDHLVIYKKENIYIYWLVGQLSFMSVQCKDKQQHLWYELLHLKNKKHYPDYLDACSRAWVKNVMPRVETDVKRRSSLHNSRFDQMFIHINLLVYNPCIE